MPGTLGNRNAVTHGIYSFLAMGSLPKGASYIRRQLSRLEDALRDAVLDKHGEISLLRAALVQTACRHEGRALLLSRWLRDRAGQMSDHDRMVYLREIGNASDARDRALKALGLDNNGRDVIDALYCGPAQDTPDTGPSFATVGRSGAGPTKHTPAPEGPLDADCRAVCDLCDDEGLTGRPCPKCGKESKNE